MEPTIQLVVLLSGTSNRNVNALFNKLKQTKLHWLQNPNNQTAEDLTNISRDTCRTFKKKKRDYMKAKVKRLEENSRKKTIRKMCKGIIELKKKGYQPCAYFIKKNDVTIVAGTTSILSSCE